MVRYRPLAELEKWLSQRVEDRSSKKTAYVTIVVVLFLFFAAPLLLFLLTFLSQWTAFHGAGTATGAALGEMMHANIMFLVYFGLSALGVAVATSTYYHSLPTHLQLTADGMKLLWRHRFLNKDGDTVPWNQINCISLELPKGKTSPLDHIVRFNFGPNKALRLRLGAIPSGEERARILQGVEQFAPMLQRDAEVVEALELPPDHSYTELWLQALSGPPKRERLKPLEEKARLRDGRYTIHHALGVGGQGTAYLATDHVDNESVVLKEFILPVYVDVNVRRQSLERFEKEARILKQLNNDQVVKLLDFFVEDHRGYLVLEHIDGFSLRDLVQKEGPFNEDRARELAAQMCTIQTYLHELTPPVVHRDFTPDNLILRKDGMLKLVDFNVAQQTESTATGTVVGKHAYLPPEQFRGQPTTQSDIYALGASLFYILTGEDPEPISVLHPKNTKPEVSRELDSIVAKSTAIELKDRYAKAQDVEKDLIASSVAGATREA